MTHRVPIEELVDVERLRRGDRPLSPRDVRAALPRGWVLDPDGEHAHRDARLFFREAWILLLGLVLFGAFGAAFLWSAMPRGWTGALRIALLVAVVVVAGGVVGPLVTRALTTRRSPRKRG